jgi:hypothetical protein
MAVLGLVAACSTSDPDAGDADAAAAAGDHAAHGATGTGALTPAQLQGVADVRSATIRFRDFAAAAPAGYTDQYPAGCAESPQGAQAFHYLNPALVDGTVDLLNPELLMYEPQPNGAMQLIGVDYVVPLAASATPPVLLGVEFARNEPLEVWALHIWSERTNPSGMFAAWNPAVTCQHAPASRP